MKYLPDWFPGTGFKRVARQMRADLEELYDVPFNYVLSEMVSSTQVQETEWRPTNNKQAKGPFIPSFTSKYLEENPNSEDTQREFVKAAAASLYSGDITQVYKILCN